MFQIETLTEARLATVTTRIQKHGEEDLPAVSLGLEIETGNQLLDVIDPTLRPTLYKPHDDQPTLDGVEQALTVLRCNSIDRVALPTKHEGWTLLVDTNGDEEREMMFGSCKVDKLSVEPKQGGTVVLRMRIGTSDLDAERSGMIGMHVGQPIWIKLFAPKPKADAIDGTAEAFKRDHPDATDLFAGDPDPDSEGGEPDVRPVVQLSDEAAWPFPRTENLDSSPPPQSVTEEPAPRAALGTRTARGRAKTKAAIEASQVHP